MSATDVIELDSSDEDSQRAAAPKPQVKKAQKRPLNAMVHIPEIAKRKLLPKTGHISVKSNKVLGLNNRADRPYLTIKPLNAVSHVGNKIKIKPGITNFESKANLAKYPSKAINSRISLPASGTNSGKSVHNICPSKIISNIEKTVQLFSKNFQNFNQGTKINPIKLPPGITVTKTSTSKPKIRINPLNTKTNPQPGRLKSKPKPVLVETVELDGDESDEPQASSSAVPQWYMQPEVQSHETNEKEPEKFLEITIEDSPLKSISEKINGTENNTSNSADKSTSNDKELNKEIRTPNSRKRLQYPGDTPSSTEKTIEIEIEPYCPDHEQSTSTDKIDKQEHIVIEIQESPVRKKKKENPDVTPKKTKPESQSSSNSPEVLKKKEANTKTLEEQNFIIEIPESPVKKKEITKKNKTDNDTDQFVASNSIPRANVTTEKSSEKVIEVDLQTDEEEIHPLYKSFIDLCFSLENTDDMRKIVDRKVKNYYFQLPKEYIESEEFTELVSSRMELMKATPTKMFLYIKDVVDELNMQRKIAKMQLNSKKNERVEEVFGELPSDAEDCEREIKRRRQIRKLEKTLKKLQNAINKLEEEEVDFDDDADSVYIITERYKERLVRVHAKLCQLSNVKMPSEPRVNIEPRPGQPAGPARRLDKWVNRRVPMGTPLPFPDFHDVLRCVKDANTEDNLGWNDVDVMEEARDLFTRCGKKLQRRRQENEWRIAATRVFAVTDPAEASEDLRRKLDDNRRIALVKEEELINKFAERQKHLKLEPKEIGDKEAEESPESDDDDINDAAKEQKSQNQRDTDEIQETSTSNKDENKEENEMNVNKEDVKKLDASALIEIDESQDSPSDITAGKCSPKTVHEDDSKFGDKFENNINEKGNSSKNNSKETKESVNEIRTRCTSIDTLSDESDDESDGEEQTLLKEIDCRNEEATSVNSLDNSSNDQSDEPDNNESDNDIVSIEYSSDDEIEQREQCQSVASEHEPKNAEGEVSELEIEFENDNTDESHKKQPNENNKNQSEDSVSASTNETTLNGCDAENSGKQAKDIFINMNDDAISISEAVIGDVSMEIENTEKVEDNIIDSVPKTSDEGNITDEVKHSMSENKGRHENNGDLNDPKINTDENTQSIPNNNTMENISLSCVTDVTCDPINKVINVNNEMCDQENNENKMEGIENS